MCPERFAKTMYAVACQQSVYFQLRMLHGDFAMLTEEPWAPIYIATIGKRNVKVERNGYVCLRAVTTACGTEEEIVIDASTPDQLEDRLIVYGQFTETQAAFIMHKISLDDAAMAR